MSQRREIQDTLADWCRDNNLDQVYGVITGKRVNDSGRSIREVTFCAARTLDGSIEIYGPKFILIRSSRTQDHVARSLEEALEYMKENFG